MPIIYLSPSTQDWNPYVTGSGSEEDWMNRIADDLEPYLLSNGIQFGRNSPEMTAASSIAQANSSYYDFYLALHSNASGQGEPRPTRGIIAFFYPGSGEGQRAAGLIAAELKKIYPLPDRVTTQATTTLGEVRRSNAPAVLVEIGYHDNVADAQWIEGHTDAIAQQLARALTELFGLPFIYPTSPRQGRVRTAGGSLNLRSTPERDGTVIARMNDGDPVTVYGEWQGWYVVHHENHVGYAAAAFIDV